jgi:hypothetical protein
LDDDGRPRQGGCLCIARTLQEPLCGRWLVGLPHNRSKPSRALSAPRQPWLGASKGPSAPADGYEDGVLVLGGTRLVEVPLVVVVGTVVVVVVLVVVVVVVVVVVEVLVVVELVVVLGTVVVVDVVVVTLGRGLAVVEG